MHFNVCLSFCPFGRFAQFFLCPLFDESCKDREVNAVDSEHEKNLMNDAWRLFQLEKATGNKDHPFSKFGTGRISREFLPCITYHLIIFLNMSGNIWVCLVSVN